MYYDDIFLRSEADYRRQRARDDWFPVRRRSRRKDRTGRRGSTTR